MNAIMKPVEPLSVHPAAARFPMLDDKRLHELADDIAANGLREPVKLYCGDVIDGRNRLAACELAGIAPRFESIPPDSDPYAYVWSLNGQRRDIGQDQRYLIWKRLNEDSEGWRAEQCRIRDAANAKRSEAIKDRPRNDDGTLAASASTSCGRSGSAPRGQGSAAKAAASKTNRGSVERMDRLDEHRPDLADKVLTGEITATEAVREMRRDEVRADLDSIEARETKAASGVYDVVVIDPPWPLQKIERDERQNQVALDYPTMTEDELRGLSIPCADDCHVWVWTTHKYLPMALRLLDAWGLKYVCTFVWHKPGGFQPFGLPQYNCEFALYARKGSPQFLDTKALPVCFDAPRRKHSEKPQAFYDVVRRVTGGRRLDMFNRRAIEGFDGWGNESA